MIDGDETWVFFSSLAPWTAMKHFLKISSQELWNFWQHDCKNAAMMGGRGLDVWTLNKLVMCRASSLLLLSMHGSSLSSLAINALSQNLSTVSYFLANIPPSLSPTPISSVSLVSRHPKKPGLHLSKERGPAILPTLPPQLTQPPLHPLPNWSLLQFVSLPLGTSRPTVAPPTTHFAWPVVMSWHERRQRGWTEGDGRVGARGSTPPLLLARYLIRFNSRPLHSITRVFLQSRWQTF